MRRLTLAALFLAPLALAACETRPMAAAGPTPSDTATSQAARSGSGMQGAGAATNTPPASVVAPARR